MYAFRHYTLDLLSSTSSTRSLQHLVSANDPNCTNHTYLCQFSFKPLLFGLLQIFPLLFFWERRRLRQGKRASSIIGPTIIYLKNLLQSLVLRGRVLHLWYLPFAMLTSDGEGYRSTIAFLQSIVHMRRHPQGRIRSSPYHISGTDPTIPNKHPSVKTGTSV